MHTHRRTLARAGLGLALGLAVALVLAGPGARADKTDVVTDVEGQPLAGNATRLLEALEFLGAPASEKTADALKAAIKDRDAAKIQELLDPNVTVQVTINPESRVKVKRGPAEAKLQQHGFVPVLVKVVNESTVKKPLRISSPQAGPIFSGGGGGNVKDEKGRFLQAEMFTAPPMTANLSGLRVEYAIALLYSTEAGKREVTLAFDVGQGTQDLGFRGEVPVLFDVRPAVPVKLSIKDTDGKPTVGRFTFRDKAGRVYPSRAKRLAPDFFFQDQVYRPDGGTVLLPPGEFSMTYGRGPEYRMIEQMVKIPEKGDANIEVKLDRWINAADYGFYSGDHHIHAAGCAHYTSPTEGVFANDMFLHVKGEGLNVGCNLTWGPCFEFQRQFFEPTVNKLSEPFCVLKYDIEVSGFGSQALGHVCLLNLRDQEYPGSDGTKTKGWPTWTTPLMRWAKAQGAVTGYAHSASGLVVARPEDAARRVLERYDTNKDGELNAGEAGKASLLPEDFATTDANKDGLLSARELTASAARSRDRLPNLVIPPMDGIGAQEICVTVSQKLCDFISAMDTQRVPEWNCWYHVMNCGFPLKASGETDFPCISGSRVGQGRVYVQLGKVEKVDYAAWCEGIAKGRSYVSDGYAHALEFTVNGKTMGHEAALEKPGKVEVKAKVAFAKDMPLGTAVGGQMPQGKTRKVELVVNGQAVASKEVPADDKVHDLTFEVPIERSSWVALRHFPQMHTNPVNVIVDGKPIRASRKSAEWCLATIEQLWRVRGQGIAKHEREEAEKTFQKAMEVYRRLAREAPEGS
jgi:hypothetical protein